MSVVTDFGFGCSYFEVGCSSVRLVIRYVLQDVSFLLNEVLMTSVPNVSKEWEDLIELSSCQLVEN